MTTKPKIDDRENRAVTRALELRAADNKPRTASGYAALFNSTTDIGGYWKETIAPGAFTRSLKERDVIAVHSHNTGRVVGRMNAGTLSLREDETGLAFENELPETTDGRDLAISIDRGDIPGMSFAFRATKQEWDDTVDPPHRTIIEAELYEITYTALPAYPDTTVGLRSLEHLRTEAAPERNEAPNSRNAARRMRLAQIERRI